MDYKILKFSAVWCGPCKAQHTEFVNNAPKVAYAEFDIESDDEVMVFEKDGGTAKAEKVSVQDLVERYRIKSVPTMILVDSDLNEVKRWCGFTKTADIDAGIDEVRKAV